MNIKFLFARLAYCAATLVFVSLTGAAIYDAAHYPAAERIYGFLAAAFPAAIAAVFFIQWRHWQRKAKTVRKPIPPELA